MTHPGVRCHVCHKTSAQLLPEQLPMAEYKRKGFSDPITLCRSCANQAILCSFCGKSQHQVEKLIAGPTVFICDECVQLCMDIVKEERAHAARAEAGSCCLLPDCPTNQLI